MSERLRGNKPPRSSRGLSALGWPALLLLALAIATYLNADHEVFLFDSKHIEQVKQTESAGGAVRDFFKGRLNPDAPLTFLTFAWNYSFNKAVGVDDSDVTTFLAVNILLHCLNALLVLILVRDFLREGDADETAGLWMPLFLSALFVVHPLNASSVAYIIQRRGLLATTFYLLGVISFLRVRSSPRDPGTAREMTGAGTASPASEGTWTRERLAWLMVLPVFYWLSLRSKNLGLTLPLMCLVIELCLRAREQVPLRRTLTLLFGMLLLSGSAILVFLFKRGLFEAKTLSIGYFGPEPSWGFWEHLLTEARVFVHYWKLLLLPLPQWSTIDHDFPLTESLLDGPAVAAVMFHLLVLATAVYAAYRRRFLVAAGIAWFYVALIPYAFLPQREVFAEYKTYLPGIGLILVLAGLLRRPGIRGPKKLQLAVLAIIIVGLFALTVSRNTIYQSRLNLWTDAVQKSPGKWRTHYNLGVSFTEEDRYPEAERHYSEALRLEPGLYLAHSNMAGVLVRQGRIEEAISHYREVLLLRPEWSKAHYRLANALARTGRNEEAITYFSSALEIEPDLVEAHANLAIVLAQNDRLDEAIEHLRTAARLRPDSVAVQRELQKLLLRHGQEGLVDGQGDRATPEPHQSVTDSIP